MNNKLKKGIIITGTVAGLTALLGIGMPNLARRGGECREISDTRVNVSETFGGILPWNLQTITLYGEDMGADNYVSMGYSQMWGENAVTMHAHDTLGNGLDYLCINTKCTRLNYSDPASVQLFADARKKWDENCRKIDCASIDRDWKAKKQEVGPDWFRERM